MTERTTVATMLASLIAALFVPAATPAASPLEMPKDYTPLLSPQSLIERVQSPDRRIVFLDVREPEEFSEGHIPGAINILEREFATSLEEIPSDALVVPYCNMDFRGFVAIEQLRALGLKDLALMQERGINGWRDQGLPIAGPETGLSDEAGLKQLRELPLESLLGDSLITRVPPSGRTHRIEMVASEWYFEPNDLEVQPGDEVRIRITSEKGSHFFVQPDYELAAVLPESKTVEISFVADVEGDFRFGTCEWDGRSLQVMKGRLRVRRATEE